MKIHRCFISNSSSSSFIVLFKNPPNKCEVCGRSDLAIVDIIEKKKDSFNTEINFKGKDNIPSCLCFYDESTGKIIKEKIDNLLKEKEEGWEVASIDIGHGDDKCMELFNKEVEKGNVIIIHSSEG